MRAKLALAIALLGLVATSTTTSLSAHHAFAAEFDANKPVKFEGTVTRMQWINPHVWLHMEVKKPDGTLENWAFEAGTPSGMIRNGFKQNVIKAGAEVTITGFKGRDESHNIGMLRQLTTADGQTYGMFGPQEGPGAR